MTAVKPCPSNLTVQLGHLTSGNEYTGSSQCPGNDLSRGNKHLRNSFLTLKLPQRPITTPVHTDLKLAYQAPLYIAHKSHPSHPQVGTLPPSYCNTTILL
jgi:hypothetical protein